MKLLLAALAVLTFGAVQEGTGCRDHLMVSTMVHADLRAPNSENGEYFGFTNECADEFFETEDWHGHKYEVVVNGFLEQVLVFRDGNHCGQSCGRISPIVSDHVYNFKEGDLLYHARLAEPCPEGYIQVGTLALTNNIVGDGLSTVKTENIADCQYLCEELENHKCVAFMYGNEDLKYKHGDYCKLSEQPIPEVDFGTNFRFCQRKLPCTQALRVIDDYPGEMGEKGAYFGFEDACADQFFGTKNWKNQHWHVMTDRHLESPKIVKIITFKDGPHCGESCGRVLPLEDRRANDWRLGDLIFHAPGYEHERAQVQAEDESASADSEDHVAALEDSTSQFTNFAMVMVLSGAAFGMGYYLSKFRAKSGLVSDYQNME